MKETNKIFDSHPSGKTRPLAVFDFSCETEDSIFTQEDVKKAENEGYSKGFTEGLELGSSQGELKANRETDAILQEMLLKIDLHLQEIRESEKFFNENFFSNIVKVCQTVLKKSMPYFFTKYGEEEMLNILQDVIDSLTIKVPIQVKISDCLHKNLSTKFQTLFASYPETIDVINVPEFSDGMCEINWESGSAKWNLDARYQEINSKLQEYLNTDKNQGEHHG